MTLADIRPALRWYLLQDSAILALVGTRVYPIKLPQPTTQPSIVYTRISGLGDHHSEGASGLTRPRVQVDCWAPTHDVASVLANLVKGRIDGFSGTIAWDDNSPGNAVAVQAIMFESEREDYDDTAKLYRVSRDYMIWYEET